MDEAKYLKIVRREHRGFIASIFRFALAMATGPYRLVVALRNLAFDRGWKAVHHVKVPVVSVGNITLGGTGKTPMVEWVSRWFRDRSRRVAILSRGYGQDDGMNDEGRVLEENLPDVPHLQGADRVTIARTAIEELESEVLVLDDGFQHRRLKRDLDIVLLDALEPFGLGRLFPRGLLREPIKSLRRAQVVVLSRSDLVSEQRRAEIRSEAEHYAGVLPWVEASHRPIGLLDADGNLEPLESLSHRRVAGFCGIGNPDGFRRTIDTLGTNLVGFRAFRDHHPYSSRDVADILSWAGSINAELLLTTQKDLVKLRAKALGSIPLRALKIGLEIHSGQEILEMALTRISTNPTSKFSC